MMRQLSQKKAEIISSRISLQQIYKILSTTGADKKVSISKLAYDWGFNHLSRFSQEYREEFGENPSETKGKIF